MSREIWWMNLQTSISVPEKFRISLEISSEVRKICLKHIPRLERERRWVVADIGKGCCWSLCFTLNHNGCKCMYLKFYLDQFSNVPFLSQISLESQNFSEPNFSVMWIFSGLIFSGPIFSGTTWGTLNMMKLAYHLNKMILFSVTFCSLKN